MSNPFVGPGSELAVELLVCVIVLLLILVAALLTD